MFNVRTKRDTRTTSKYGVFSLVNCFSHSIGTDAFASTHIFIYAVKIYVREMLNFRMNTRHRRNDNFRSVALTICVCMMVSFFFFAATKDKSSSVRARKNLFAIR